MGPDCNELKVDGELKQLATLNFLISVEDSMKTAEFDVRSFIYWVSILEALLLTPHVLSRGSFLKALDILDYAFDKDEQLELHVTEDDMRRVARVLDVLLRSVLSRQVYYVPQDSSQCPDDALLKFSDLFNKFQLLLLARMVEGEDELTLWAETFRSSTQHASLGDWISLEVPLTLLSKFSKDKETASDYPPSLTTNLTKSLAIFSLKSRIYGECAKEFIANPVHVVFDHRDVASVDTSTLSTSLSLPNNVQQDLPLPAVDTIFRTDCVTGDFNSYNYTCYVSSKKNITVTHTCLGLSARLTSPCPTVYIEPECRIIGGADSLFGCSVTSFTLQDTKCNCHATIPAARHIASSDVTNRKLSAIDRTYSLRVVTVLHAVVEDIQVETAAIFYVPLDEASYFSVQSVSAIFTIVLVFLLYSIHQDQLKGLIKVKPANKANDAGIGTDIFSTDCVYSRSKAGQDLCLYLSSLLPPLFKSSMPLWDRIYVEVVQNHRFLTGMKCCDDIKYGPDCTTLSSLTMSVLKILVVQSFVLLKLTVLCYIQVISFC
jgi:hypothetical protein